MGASSSVRTKMLFDIIPVRDVTRPQSESPQSRLSFVPAVDTAEQHEAGPTSGASTLQSPVSTERLDRRGQAQVVARDSLVEVPVMHTIEKLVPKEIIVEKLVEKEVIKYIEVATVPFSTLSASLKDLSPFR